jgi:hypothetical protein
VKYLAAAVAATATNIAENIVMVLKNMVLSLFGKQSARGVVKHCFASAKQLSA